MIFGGPFPATTEDWVALFQRNKILGLLYLNALDIFSIALLGTMFLALYIALKRYNQASMLIATYIAMLGGVFVVPRVAMLSIVTLSDQYTAATTEAQRTTGIKGQGSGTDGRRGQGSGVRARGSALLSLGR